MSDSPDEAEAEDVLADPPEYDGLVPANPAMPDDKPRPPKRVRVEACD